ncbi:MAG: hypothetical protein J5582_14560 [Ruminococcus sp.]|uniref:hypothetical protein n=1 Tax=Ruminococcus sp. TaxID=41978 RepID=UPI0025EBC647|nr:hypothetical protein [Ruminococcus sp.]MBO4867759.1 hypothetical protein [Ruminococcus sp.]
MDKRHVYLDYSDAPDGTAYIDVLVKKDEIGDDMYTDFNAPPERLADKRLDEHGTTEFIIEDLNIDSSSDIAGYNDDGYVSLSVHSKEVERITIEKSLGYEHDSLDFNVSANDICKKYRGIKLAYVSEDGKVLDVTKTKNRSYDIKKQPEFTASGEKAEFRTTEFSPLGKLASFLLLLNVLIIVFVIPVMIIVHIVNKIRWKIWVRKQLHTNSGSEDDADNT